MRYNNKMHSFEDFIRAYESPGLHKITAYVSQNAELSDAGGH
jgi:hypothetical protein